jgi:acetyl esterase
VSAVVCLDAKARGGAAPRAQLLMYPATELRRSMASHRTFADGFLLTTKDMDWFIEHYVPAGGDALDHPRASPFRAPDLSGLPAAFVQTAGFDPLRDEGMAYAERLAAAGVKTEARCYGGLVHGYASFAGGVPAAYEALEDAWTWLAKTV